MTNYGRRFRLGREPGDGTQLMDVRYEGEMILMFTDDMKTHTEPVKLTPLTPLS
jgi:hypothetical protein